MISQKDVKHIVYLARIELADGEITRYEKELSSILEFVEKLNRVDTDKVESMTGGTTLENVMRADKQTDASLEEKAAELLEAAPEKKEGWVKVRAVFKE